MPNFFLRVEEQRTVGKIAAGTFDSHVMLLCADRDDAKRKLESVLAIWPKDMPYTAAVIEQNNDVKREDGAVAKNRVEEFASSDPAFAAQVFDEDAPLMYRPLVVDVADPAELAAEKEEALPG